MIEIIITTLFVYILYYLITIRKFDKTGALKKKNDKTVYESLPKEVQFFVSFYHIDMDKINVKGLLNLLAIVLGISITLSIIIASYITKNETYLILLGVVFLIPIYLIGLKIVSIQFKKRGLIKNGKHKRNRK